MKILAVDIGGTNVKYGYVDSDNYQIKKTISTPTLITKVGQQIEEIIKKAKQEEEFNLVAICTAGVVNTKDKTIVYANNNLPGYTGFDFKTLEKKFNLKIVVINDANAACLVEKIKQQTPKNYATVTFGTGVGVGIVMNDQVFMGNNYLGGELGYLKVNEVLLDQYLSYSNFTNEQLKQFNVEDKKELSAVINDLYNKEKQFQINLDQYFKKAADFLTNLAITLNLDHIYVAGGISYLNDQFLDLLWNKFKDNLKNTPFKTTISLSQFKNNAGLLGAVYFALNY